MVRASLVVALLLAGCGGYGAVRTIGNRQVGVRQHTDGAVRLVSFVNVADSVVGASTAAGFATVLPGGDWLAILDSSLVRLSPDGRSIRWTATGINIWDAVDGPEGRVIAVGTIKDATALNGEARTLFMLDTTSGAIVWRAIADPTTRGASAQLARIGTTTVAASAYGEAAVDDTGKVLWVTSHRESDDYTHVVAIGGTLVALSTPLRTSNDFGAEPLHVPLVIRTLDIATGAARGRFELAADQDYFAIGQLGFAADGRVALNTSDIRVTTKASKTPEGEPMTVQSTAATARLVVLDVTDATKPTARALAMPAEQLAAMPSTLAPSEVVFVDRYANDGGTLSLRIVDLASPRLRRVPIVRTAKTYSSVQLTQLAARPDRIAFAGQFTGKGSPLRGRVEEVDGCEARGGIECFNTPDTVTLAPVAAVIGTVAFTRNHTP